MSSLIISLPLAAASPNSLYALTEGPGTGSVREAAAHLLPRTGRNADVVAVVPATALSWHAVDLPAGKALSGPNLRAVLVGLLEERVLGEASQLHFALQPQWQAGQKTWVAVCHKAWLQGHLQALEAADISVNRVVPELHPQAAGVAAQLLVTGTPQAAWLWVSAAQGVWGLPFPSGLEALSPDLLTSAQLSAEPAVAESAEHQLHLKPRLVQPAERLLTAAQSDWDLAQFDLAATGSARWLKTLGRVKQTLWQSSAWRPARWGLAVLVLSQLLGLNAWAWKLQADLRQRQTSMGQVMTQTFPEIQVVVDAPLQMRREVQRLRQAAGQTGSDGLEPLLAALGQALPAGQAVTQIDFEAGELRLKDLALTETQIGPMQTRLQAQQVQARREGADWVITTQITTSTPRSTP
jgi:general secretion pathway protein L